jgi:hypothetical protein
VDRAETSAERVAPRPHVLREYAFLGDGRRGALVGPRGDIGFMCVPDWHSPAVFCAMLGGRGHYTVTPADGHHVWGGYYEPATLIWTSRWVTRDAVIHSREALAFPGDPHHAVLLRQIRAVDGDAVVDVRLDLRAGFGTQSMEQIHDHGNGMWSGRSGNLWWRWSGAFGVHEAGGELVTRVPVGHGECHDLTLVVGDREPECTTDPAVWWTATENAWRDRAPRLERCVAGRDAVHAISVLRGLTHPDSGMVAAATTSLPERAESGRNYDYRFAWIRDQSFAGQAAAAADVPDLLDAAVRFVTARVLADGPRLAPAYAVAPAGPVPDERRLTHLPGYPGGDVRTGNHINKQFQLDVFGECLLLFAAAGRADRLDADAAHATRIVADAVGQRWREPDAGIWELDDHRWTHSALMCVAGLRAAALTAPRNLARDWSHLADAVLADLTSHHVHRTGRWQRARDDARVDASLLFPVIRGALPADDPRSVATLAAVTDELTDDGYVYRFRPDDRPLGEAEGAFLLCGYALARATHQAGDPVVAGRVFERTRASCGPAGIYAEEYDVTQRQMRGNLPQAFVHATMLDTAVALSEQPGSS